MKDTPLLKGLFIGAACGLMAGWFGMPQPRAFFLGCFVGMLAGLTKKFLSKKKSNAPSGHLQD